MTLKLDIAQTPFSRYGSFFSFRDCRVKRSTPLGPGLYLRSNHGRLALRELLKFDLCDGKRKVKSTLAVSPAELTMKGPGSRRVRIAFEGRETIRCRAKAVGLRLQVQVTPGTVAMPQPEGRWQVILWRGNTRMMLTCLRGSLQAAAPWRGSMCKRIVFTLVPDGEGILEAAIDLFESTWVPRRRRPFASCVAQVRREFRAWLKKQPPAPKPLRRAWEHAAYVNWAAVVAGEGLLTRDAMVMSKNHMDNVWSWDHCFNAMALSCRHPSMAFDQWMIMPDQQDVFGCFPDAINDRFRHFCFHKPPVHGWAFDFMCRQNPKYFTKKRVAEAYDPLCRWSRWWMTHRTWPGDDLPYYLHGNDSGWDNSTMFDEGTPLVAPDLGAFLALQLDVLAGMAKRLGKPRDAARWRRASERVVRALIRDLWLGDHFVAVKRPGGKIVECRSLVPCMPIVLGKRLPEEIQRALVKNIRTFLTRHGLATEHPASPEYSPDGYWRGPIWAPSTMLVVSGLLDTGQTALARTIAARFCRMCARSGFAENFDALTGAGLCDKAYTWTSSVFLVLAHELSRRKG